MWYAVRKDQTTILQLGTDLMAETNLLSARGRLDRRPAARAIVADVLRRRIALGGFVPGSRLPTEREIAAALGVGRTTVRQAVRLLREEGIVTTTSGRNGGSRVGDGRLQRTGRRERITAEFERFLKDAMECRIAIEPFAAQLAAGRATRNERRRLSHLMKEGPSDLGSFHRLDTEFHLAVAEASHNTMLFEEICRAREVMFLQGNALWLLTDWSLVVPKNQWRLDEVFHGGHQPIATAIARRDPVAARVAMAAHLEESAEQFLSLLHGIGRSKAASRA